MTILIITEKARLTPRDTTKHFGSNEHSETLRKEEQEDEACEPDESPDHGVSVPNPLGEVL